MKILYITGYISMHGGLEKVTSSKVNYLADHTEHEVFLSTYKQNGKPFVYPISKNVKWIDLGIPYDVNYADRPLYTWRQFKHVPLHIWKTWKLIRKIKPDVIVVTTFDYEYWFTPFLKGKAKIIREFHASQGFRLQPTTRKIDAVKLKINDWAQRHYDKVVVLTPEEKEYFQYRDNIAVISNAIDESQYKSSLNNNQVIAVGRIAPEKQYEKFIEVAEVVHKSLPDVIFKIYGNGEPEYEQSLRNMISEKNLENVVLMPGRTSEVAKMMSESDLYLCTSKEESFSLTIAEAQENGLPVVSFDCPNGPRNIINNGRDGILVPLDSVQEAASAVISIMSDSERLHEMGTSASKNVEKFHLDHVMNKWIELWDRLLKADDK